MSLERYREDPALVLRAKTDPEAAGELYSRYGDAIAIWARAADEDLQAAARLAFVRAVAAYDPTRGTFSAVLRSAIRQHVCDAVRAECVAHGHPVVRMKIQPAGERLSSGPEIDTSPDPREAARHAELREAVLGLTALQQKIVLLHYDGGLSLEEVAAKCGRTKQSVHGHLRKAISVLRKKLA